MSKNLLGKRVTVNTEGKVVGVVEHPNVPSEYTVEFDCGAKKFYLNVKDEDIVEEFTKNKNDEGFVLEDLIKEGDIWYDVMYEKVFVVDEQDIEHAEYNTVTNVIDLVDNMVGLEEDILLSRDGQVRYEGLEQLAEIYNIRVFLDQRALSTVFYLQARELWVPAHRNNKALEQAMYLLLGAISLLIIGD